MENLRILTNSSNHADSSSRSRKFSHVSNTHFLTSHTPELTPHSNTSSTPKKNRMFMLGKELQRLEEELDLKLINLNTKWMNDSNSEKRKKKELKLHERCLEGIIHCIQFFDMKIFRVLNRVWNGYQKVLNKKFNKIKTLGVLQSTNTNVTTNEVAVQTEIEEEEFTNEKEFDQYINLLNNAILRVGKMNNKNIIRALKNLLSSLNPVDVPSYDEPVVKHNKISNTKNFIEPMPVASITPIVNTKPNIVSIQIPKAVQTVTLYEGATVESLASLLVERDRQIFKLNEQVSNLQILEKKLEKSENDLMLTRKELKELQGKECKNCLDRLEKIKEDKIKIEDLKKNLEKTEVVEVELKQTKTRLRESVIVIGKSNEKIMNLTENLDDLTEKIEEVKRERKILEAKLAEEETIRINLESRLKQEIQKSYNSKQSNLKYDFSSIEEEQDDDYSFNQDILSNKSFERSNNLSDYDLANFNQKNSKSPTPAKRNSKLYNESQLLNKRKNKDLKSNKRTIFKVFQITKAEFLNLSKKARMELFECLYEHKDRCGSDCEHLRRAMMIKQREKGIIFPVKKFNIVKS